MTPEDRSTPGAGNPVAPGSGSGYTGIGGFPAPEGATPVNVNPKVLVLGVVETTDACGFNFDDGDRLGSFYGGESESRSMHSGVDIQANLNDPVYAVSGGTLARFDNEDKPCGYGVIITHDDGTFMTYCHFNQQSPRQPGPVAAGELIGLAGKSGNARGVHVHITYGRGWQKDLKKRMRKEFWERTGERPSEHQLNKDGC